VSRFKEVQAIFSKAETLEKFQEIGHQAHVPIELTNIDDLKDFFIMVMGLREKRAKAIERKAKRIRRPAPWETKFYDECKKLGLGDSHYQGLKKVRILMYLLNNSYITYDQRMLAEIPKKSPGPKRTPATQKKIDYTPSTRVVSGDRFGAVERTRYPTRPRVVGSRDADGRRVSVIAERPVATAGSHAVTMGGAYLFGATAKKLTEQVVRNEVTLVDNKPELYLVPDPNVATVEDVVIDEVPDNVVSLFGDKVDQAVVVEKNAGASKLEEAGEELLDELVADQFDADLDSTESTMNPGVDNPGALMQNSAAKVVSLPVMVLPL